LTQSDPISIRVNLEGDNASKFEAIKKSFGLKQNTEVIRSLIRDAYIQLQQNAGEVEPVAVEARI